MFARSRRGKFYISSIFLNNLFQLTPTLMFDFTVTIITIVQFAAIFMMEE